MVNLTLQTTQELIKKAHEWQERPHHIYIANKSFEEQLTYFLLWLKIRDVKNVHRKPTGFQLPIDSKFSPEKEISS